MPKAVIFDVDGTLIDTVALHAEAWADTFRHFGQDIPAAAIRGQIGKGGDQLMPEFLEPDLIEKHGEEMERFRANVFRERYFPRASGFPFVRDLFQRIREDGSAIALASSCKTDELGRYMDLAKVTDLVDATATSDDADRSKPHPDIFQAALENLGGMAPSDAVVVGDSPYDAEAAGKAGLPVVGLLCGGFDEEKLRTAGCSAIYRDPEDLLRNFERSPLTAA